MREGWEEPGGTGLVGHHSESLVLLGKAGAQEGM